MKEKTYWDFSRIPDELRRPGYEEEDVLQADIAKRTWKYRVVRHKVKQYIHWLLSKYNEK